MSSGSSLNYLFLIVFVCHGSLAETPKIESVAENSPRIIDYGGLTGDGRGDISRSRRGLGELERPRPDGRPHQNEFDRPPRPNDRPNNHFEFDRPKPNVNNDHPSSNGGHERPRPDDRPNHESSHSHRGPQLIPGTNLKTRTFYKLSMKRFPYGYVTWTSRKNFQHGYRYIQVDNNRDHAHHYERNGQFFQDAQWEFVPVSSDDRYRWYKLRNRGRPREYSTWSLNEFLNEYSQSNYLILDPNYPGRRSRTDFLFRPVLVKGNRDQRDGRDYYQLKLKEHRRGVISVSRDTEYATECYYIQVDNDNNEKHMRRYEKGNDRYDDTLFSIVLADGEYIDDEEDIENNNDDKFDDDL